MYSYYIKPLSIWLFPLTAKLHMKVSCFRDYLMENIK